MIAVLIDSRKLGSSGWINVRSSQRILVRGMQRGDNIYIYYSPDDKRMFNKVVSDCEISLNGEKMVKAEIVKISEGSRIYVDLE